MENEVLRHCPNPHCPNHDESKVARRDWYRPHGWYACPSDPERHIRRYRCATCGKTFSETYFTRSWHLQRKDIDDVELLFEWCKGSATSSLAKLFKCSNKTIATRIERMQELARQKDVVFDLAQPS